MNQAIAISQKNDGALRPREFLKTSFPTRPFYFKEPSEMTVKTTENAAKASVVTRDIERHKARQRVKEIAGQEGYVKDQIRRAHLWLLPALPAIKFSRVKDIMSSDDRIHVRGEETEGILQRWEAWLEREEKRHSAAADRARQILQKRRGPNGHGSETDNSHPAVDPALAPHGNS